jgi:hypothetical protein
VKVEVLYVADCPSSAAAVKLVKDVLNTEQIAAQVHEVLVEDARMADELQFPGSPTIRIDGCDVAGGPETPAFALSCRLYPESKQIGLPLVDRVRRTVVEARERGRP